VYDRNIHHFSPIPHQRRQGTEYRYLRAQAGVSVFCSHGSGMASRIESQAEILHSCSFIVQENIFSLRFTEFYHVTKLELVVS